MRLQCAFLLLLVLVCCMVVRQSINRREGAHIRRAYGGRTFQVMRAQLREQTPTHECAAVMVEPREHRNLLPVIRLFLARLPEHVPLQIFHGTRNAALLAREFSHHPRVHLRCLGVENMQINDYSALLTAPEFWSACIGRHILIFQTDAILCGKAARDYRAFLRFDYIGARWHYPVLMWTGLNRGLSTLRGGGNGGLSMRKRETMVTCCRRYPWHQQSARNEDMYFAVHVPLLPGVTLPSDEDCALFSYDHRCHTPTHTSDQMFGIHKNLPPEPWVGRLHPSERDILTSYGRAAVGSTTTTKK